MTHKVDNAHSVDEETNASPFEDETPIEVFFVLDLISAQWKQ